MKLRIFDYKFARSLNLLENFEVQINFVGIFLNNYYNLEIKPYGNKLAT